MSEHLPGPAATAAPAAEPLNQPRCIMRALALLLGPGTAALPVPQALFSQKGIRWLQGAAAGTGKCPGKLFANNGVAVGGGCVPGLSAQPGTGWHCSPLPHGHAAPTSSQAGWHCHLITHSARLPGWRRSVRLAGLGSQCSAGEQATRRENTAEPGRGQGSRGAKQTLLILGDTRAERGRGAQELSRQLLEGQGVVAPQPHCAQGGCHVEG